jgi:hypothetical protein
MLLLGSTITLASGNKNPTLLRKNAVFSQYQREVAVKVKEEPLVCDFSRE